MTQTMSQPVAIPLARLAHGAINVRAGEDDAADLIASIRAHGLLQPLVGRTRDDGRIEIIDGGRRLAALRGLAALGEGPHEVAVILRDDGDEAQAYELSLAANVVRKALHPVAEFEAFAALHDKGRAIEEIADHFGITENIVRQRLALGRLHPEVRAAWREGRISGEAAKAFCVAAPAAQANYLRAATQDWQIHPNHIRDALTVGAMDADAPIALFVGLDAYRAAGGAIVPDLFAQTPILADSGLVERLAAGKLASEAARLKDEEGWAQVYYGDDAAKRWSMERLPQPAAPEREETPREAEIEARLREIESRRDDIDAALEEIGDDGDRAAKAQALRDEDDALAAEAERLAAEHRDLGADDLRAAWMSLPDETRGGAVAFLDIGDDGGLTIAGGYVARAARPTPTPRAAPQDDAARDDVPPRDAPVALSATLAQTMTQAATRAAAETLALRPRLAKAALLAAEATWRGPVQVTWSGRGHGPEPILRGRHNPEVLSFGAALDLALRLDDAGLDAALAGAVARALDFSPHERHGLGGAEPEAVAALRAALPQADHRAALVAAFDAQAYFEAAPKGEALACLADCGEQPGKAGKKADLAARAARAAAAREWLPQMLRGAEFAALPEAGADEASQAETPAQAAARIWSEEDATPDERDTPSDPRAAFAALTSAKLRAALKEENVRIPRGATHDQLVAMLIEAREENLAEAAQ